MCKEDNLFYHKTKKREFLPSPNSVKLVVGWERDFILTWGKTLRLSLEGKSTGPQTTTLYVADNVHNLKFTIHGRDKERGIKHKHTYKEYIVFTQHSVCSMQSVR